jgi:hypothetical protein
VWEVRNFTNDLRSVEVRVPLPPNVRWKDTTFPSNQVIQYNAVTSEVVWRIGSLPAGTGILSPALVGAFQVSIVPAASDVDDAVTLVGRSVLKGVDTFTGQERELFVESFSTDIREDLEGLNTGRVVP